MKLIKLEAKPLAICSLCGIDIPKKGGVCFEDAEKDKVVCKECAKSISRTYLEYCLGVDLS